MALETLPDAVGHALQLSTEQVEWLLTATAIDEITGVLAFKAIVRILVQ